MTARTSKPCKKAGCRHLSKDGSGHCRDHKSTSNWDYEARQTAAQKGYDSRWRKLRQRIMRRDSGLCQTCKREGVITAAYAVDHIKPKADGGTDASHNLEAICKACHARKSAAEGGHAAKAGRIHYT